MTREVPRTSLAPTRDFTSRYRQEMSTMESVIPQSVIPQSVIHDPAGLFENTPHSIETTLLDALRVQVWTAGESGALTFVNLFTAEYFAKPRQQLIGEGWQNVLHSADVAGAVERWSRSLATGEPYEVDFRLLRGSDRTYRWHRASAVRLIVGQQPVWIGSNVDIDAEMRAEEVLQALRSQLRNRDAAIT